MQLKEFIAETFKQIIDGVLDAQAYAGPKGSLISPSNLTCRTDQGLQFWDADTDEIATLIEFDVAISATDATSTKGGIGIFVGPVGLGSQGQSDAGKSSNSRIKFTVPVHLPKSGKINR